MSAGTSYTREIGFLPGTSEGKVGIAERRPEGGAVSLPLGDDTQGQIKRAWGIYDAAPPGPNDGEVVLLPPGVVKAVKEGEAFLIQDGNSDWLSCQFPNGGELCGPLRYKSVPALTDTELIREEKRKDSSGPSSGWGAMAGLATCAFVFSVMTHHYGFWAGPDASVFSRVMTLAGSVTAALTMYLAFDAVVEFLIMILVKIFGVGDYRSVDRSVALPDIYRHLLTEAPKVTVAGDAEVDAKMQAYRQSLGQLDGLAGKGHSAETAMIRHSASMIEKVATQAQDAGHLGENDTLKSALGDLIDRAHADIQKILSDQRVKEQESLLSDIATLQSQMDLHSSRKDA